ncbi:hypothetical protein Shyd_22390 [Streptomyces hydrogenans]|uniref:Uncharacterized protein n=1 Tax=Streptomyces hydrogenans TaxID=1873719 RepID=A0ABQ3P773_9ACTN|nr:hypothetical protein GCM10018784_48900 [Streptomyces hydrogenans]GHI20868.1 hypothetical protein Shyd_22390 [Streptomyces hydrogenans]
MELSKMGPPLNSSTATTSRRRRPDSFRATSGAAESWLMTLSPPRCSRLPGRVAVPRFPSVLHETPVFGTHDRIYCVPCRRRDKFSIRHIVDKATWREAIDRRVSGGRASPRAPTGTKWPYA